VSANPFALSYFLRRRRSDPVFFPSCDARSLEKSQS
jgi:hypothetical protein